MTLYVDFDGEDFKSFKFNLQNVAALYKGKGLWFYLADPRIDHQDVFKVSSIWLSVTCHMICVGIHAARGPNHMVCMIFLTDKLMCH